MNAQLKEDAIESCRKKRIEKSQSDTESENKKKTTVIRRQVMRATNRFACESIASAYLALISGTLTTTKLSAIAQSYRNSDFFNWIFYNRNDSEEINWATGKIPNLLWTSLKNHAFVRLHVCQIGFFGVRFRARIICIGPTNSLLNGKIIAPYNHRPFRLLDISSIYRENRSPIST